MAHNLSKARRLMLLLSSIVSEHLPGVPVLRIEAQDVFVDLVRALGVPLIAMELGELRVDEHSLLGIAELLEGDAHHAQGLHVGVGDLEASAQVLEGFLRFARVEVVLGDPLAQGGVLGADEDDALHDLEVVIEAAILAAKVPKPGLKTDDTAIPLGSAAYWFVDDHALANASNLRIEVQRPSDPAAWRTVLFADKPWELGPGCYWGGTSIVRLPESGRVRLYYVIRNCTGTTTWPSCAGARTRPCPGCAGRGARP